MNNFQKRILTSIIILPLSIFFILMGGYFLIFFLFLIFLAGVYEIFTVFKKKRSAIFLSLILILSLFSIYYLGNYSLPILFFVIGISISSDIGGYAFGKIFKWKKLTKISPKKTISGVFGSYFLSFIFLFVYNEFYNFQFTIQAILMTIIFSSVAQGGDLTISYLKRLDKIKDTGKILPGHGGIFDRIDALMFVAILAFVLEFIKV